MSLPRIFFDANDGNDEYGYELKFDQSLEDMKPIAHLLRDGLRVVIYSPGEMEMEATLKFDTERNYWLGFPVEGTLQIYPEAYGPASN